MLVPRPTVVNLPARNQRGRVQPCVHHIRRMPRRLTPTPYNRQKSLVNKARGRLHRRRPHRINRPGRQGPIIGDHRRLPARRHIPRLLPRRHSPPRRIPMRHQRCHEIFPRPRLVPLLIHPLRHHIPIALRPAVVVANHQGHGRRRRIQRQQQRLPQRLRLRLIRAQDADPQTHRQRLPRHLRDHRRTAPAPPRPLQLRRRLRKRKLNPHVVIHPITHNPTDTHNLHRASTSTCSSHPSVASLT